MEHYIFVYGTLRPGDVRWHFLQRFVTDDGLADSVDGSLYDTGLDYPAAVFDDSGVIHGRTFEIAAAVLVQCLAVLDIEEDVDGGLYRRVMIRTHRGLGVWAYEYHDGPGLVPIPSGDWFEHRPPTIESPGPT